jgi:hypothetical protein
MGQRKELEKWNFELIFDDFQFSCTFSAFFSLACSPAFLPYILYNKLNCFLFLLFLKTAMRMPSVSLLSPLPDP